MQRAAVSVCSNVAEGDERDTDKDAVRFFYIAKGSIAELITQLEIAKDARLIEPGLADRLIKEAEEIGAMLGALIKARA
jgi:four helix bundle protein